MSERQYIAIIKNHPELQLWKTQHDALREEAMATLNAFEERKKESWKKADAILAELKLLPDDWKDDWNTGFNDTAVYVEPKRGLDDEIVTKIKDAFKKAMS